MASMGSKLAVELLGGPPRNAIQRDRLRRLEEASRYWSILIARGDRAAAVALTDRAVELIKHGPDHRGDTPLAAIGMTAPMVRRFEAAGMRTISDLLNCDHSVVVSRRGNAGPGQVLARDMVSAQQKAMSFLVNQSLFVGG